MGVEDPHAVVAAQQQLAGRQLVERADVLVVHHVGLGQSAQCAVLVDPHQSLFVGAQPQSSVAGLQHARGRAQHHSRLSGSGLKHVLRLVEQPQGRHARLGNSPLLLVAIGIDLPHFAADGVQTVVLYGALLVGEREAQDALPVGGNPQVAAQVGREMGHGSRQLLDGQGGELLVGKREAHHSVGGAQQQVVVLVAHQSGDSLRGHRLGQRIAHHPCAVVAAQSVVGSHPDEASPVLDDGSYGVRQ